MWLLGLLPFLVFIGAAFAFRQRGCGLGESLVRAGVNAAAWAALGAELLSSFHALGFWPLLIWWVVPVLVLAFFCWHGPRPSFQETPRDPVVLAALTVIAIILLLTLISGLVTAPSNWDALSYHLPRQVYWMQQQHVGFFSTGDTRMLTMPPLAEYIGVQLMILAGGDYWIHSIQWLAFALTTVAVSLIARDLGLNVRWQTITALLLVTIPTAVLQAGNAKNDLVTAFFLCALAFFALQIIRLQKLPAPLVWYLGATGGLLLLSKGTGMLFGLPLAIWILVTVLVRHGFRQTLRVSAVAVLIALTLNAGFVARNYLNSDSPRAQGKARYFTTLRNQIFTPQAFLSNLLRNTAMHIATDSERTNPRITSAVAALHRLIGIDLNDPRTTAYVASSPYETELGLKKEDLAKAPIHVLLGIPVFVLLAIRLIQRHGKDHWLTCLFVLLPFLAFFTFCFMLKWQLWHSRLHIPVLCLLSPVLVFALAHRVPRVLLGVCAIAVPLAVYSALFNSSKPFIGKSSILINAEKRERMQPRGAIEAARAAASICGTLKPKVIGLAVKGDHCEYTLLRTLLKELQPDPRFVKLNVSWRTGGEPPKPDLVVSWYMPPGRTPGLKLSDFFLVFSTNSVHVYVPYQAQRSPAATN